MNTKTLMIALAAFAVGGVAHAITSDEIAAALDVDPSVGTFSCSGVSDWQLDETTIHAGAMAMRSGIVNSTDSNQRSSEMTLSLNCKKSIRLSFWVKTSCYSDSYYGGLFVTIDNASYTYSGETGWTKVSAVLIPGFHTIKWAFGRRYNTSSGSNSAWVDEISFEPILPESPAVEVTDIKCTQRYPWNGKVDIDYTVVCDKENADIWIYPVGYDKDSNTTMAPRALEGDGVNAPVKAGKHRMTWTVTDDYPNFHSTAFTVKMAALVGAAPYMVLDLSGGVDALSYPVSYLSSVPEGGWSDEFRTTKLVLRLIPSGSFVMGSDSDEFGRSSYETAHDVVLTKPFYMGVFECTQRQYELVMGRNPNSGTLPGVTRPVSGVSFTSIRGSVNGIGWPVHNQVDADSFMGRLRSKANMFFDLPTEAQWEYACRAGTQTSINLGVNLSSTSKCENMATVARYYYNSVNSGTRVWDKKGNWTETTKVGCYQPNAWGLYDMHGNVWEWCLDLAYYNDLGAAGEIDPKGASSAYDGNRSYRGGGYDSEASACRSAYRYAFANPTSSSWNRGFRVYCSPVAQ